MGSSTAGGIWTVALLCAALAGTAARAQAKGSLTGQVVVLRDGAPKADRSNVVVYLEGVPGPAPAPLQGKAIRQRNLAFEPRLLVVTRGSTVAFPNDDKVFHNVFSLSSASTFDLGLYKGGTSRSVTFGTQGVVDVFCNIHPDMTAKIKVLDTAHYVVTGPDGRFHLENLPPGRYPLVAWQAFGEPFRAQVAISAGNARAPEIILVEGAAPNRHLRKDGTPYGRYK